MWQDVSVYENILYKYVCNRTESIHVQIYTILLTQDVVYNINSEALLSFFLVKSQPRKTYVVKTGSDSSMAKRSAIGMSVLQDDQ